jgi:hypothetical protein
MPLGGASASCADWPGWLDRLYQELEGSYGLRGVGRRTGGVRTESSYSVLGLVDNNLRGSARKFSLLEGQLGC